MQSEFNDGCPYGERLKLPEIKSCRLPDIQECIENSVSLVKCNVEVLIEKGGFSLGALNVRLGKAADSVNNAFKAIIQNLKQGERCCGMIT